MLTCDLGFLLAFHRDFEKETLGDINVISFFIFLSFSYLNGFFNLFYVILSQIFASDQQLDTTINIGIQDAFEKSCHLLQIFNMVLRIYEKKVMNRISI